MYNAFRYLSTLQFQILQLRRARRPLERFRLVLEVLDQLPHAQIEHDILRASRYPDSSNFARDSCEMLAMHSPHMSCAKLTLNQLSLSTLRIPIATKQQLRSLRTLIQYDTRLRLDHGG